MTDAFVESGGARLWTTVSGKGLPVILINGGPGCDDYLGGVAALLEDRCEVVRFEPRGCGRSDYDGNYDFNTMIADLEAVRVWYGFDRVTLIGHSFGPDVALAYTLAHPARVNGIVGIAGGRIVNDRTWHQAYTENKASRGEVNPKEFVADPQVNVLGNLSWKEYMRRPGLLRDIAALNCPATYIWGTEDIRPSWPTQQLAGLMKAEYVEIPGAAHCIWMTHGNELKRALHHALDRIAGANPA